MNNHKQSMRSLLLCNSRPWSSHMPHGKLFRVMRSIHYNSRLNINSIALSSCKSLSSLSSLQSPFANAPLSLHMARRHLHSRNMQCHGIGFDVAAFVQLQQSNKLTTRTQRKTHAQNQISSSLVEQQNSQTKGTCKWQSQLQQYEGVNITLRGRVSRTRVRGKLSFIELRQPPFHSIQVVCNSSELTQQVKQLNTQSIIEVKGKLVKAHSPIQSTTCSTHEVQANQISMISAAAAPLPFPLNDIHTKLDTRLNYRSVDLRTRANVAMVHILSILSHCFHEALTDKRFVQIHTPKLIASSSQGGSSVFSVNYFANSSSSNTLADSSDNAYTSGINNRKNAKLACLAQSPQLYKQMMINGDAMRVFEIGPVFRAENSLTHRHLTEFTGVDFEMVIEHSYVQVLNVLEEVMCRVLNTIQSDTNVSLLLSPASAGLSRGDNNITMNKNNDCSSCHNTTSRANGVDNTNKAVNAFRRVVCEVPKEKIQELGIVQQSQQQQKKEVYTEQEQEIYNNVKSNKVDKYHARVRLCECSTEQVSSQDANQCTPRVLRMSFVNAKQMLADDTALQKANNTVQQLESTNNGVVVQKQDDFTLLQERQLGKLIKARYGVDLYVIDQFPLSARPFYTMPLNHLHENELTNKNNSDKFMQYSCSFDMYLRGEQICSGAQRQHNAQLLQQAIEQRGLTHELNLQHYIDSFKYGAWPHGGAGLGLERIALFLLDAYDIRQVSLFPRDPKRLTP